MSIYYDKFNIIENHTIKNINVKSKVENYFENYINSDIKIISPDYINQMLWFNKNEYDIDDIIKKHLINCRNNIRRFINKDCFTLESLNKLISNFIIKLEYINNIIKLDNNLIIKKGIDHLISLIISDSFVVLFIEEKIIDFNTNYHNDIEKLFLTIKQLDNYDNVTTKIIKVFFNIHKKDLISCNYLPLPENTKRIYHLNKSIECFNNIQNYYKFINKDELERHINIIKDTIFNILFDIINKNSINDIEILFNELWHDIYYILLKNKSNDYDRYNKDICQSLVLLFDKTRNNNNINDDNMYKIINILKYTQNIISNNDIFINVIIQSNDNIYSIICNIINDLILNYTSTNINIEYINNLIVISQYIKDRDIFINEYYEKLINRLLNHFITINDNKKFKDIIDFEKNIINNIKIKYGYKFNFELYKLYKVIDDIEISYYNNKNNIIINKYFENIKIITTSYNIWNINQINGVINNSIVESIQNTQVGKYLYDYQQYYNTQYENKRILNWLPHYGEVNIIYLDKQIKMLPIQFMVLELFTDVNQIKLIDILNSIILTNYTSKIRNDIIDSLVISKLLIHNNDILKLTENNNFEIDLIEIFFRTSDYVIISQQERQDDLIHNREDIIYTNINHQLKKKDMTFDELFENIKSNINIFTVDSNIFNKSLEYMIKMDYIINNNGFYSKIYY